MQSIYGTPLKREMKKYANRTTDNSYQTLYKEYLEKPGSHKAHELLHTFYVDHSKI